MKFYLLLFLTLIFSFSAHSQKLLIYGGEKNDIYLGCLSCDKFDSDSIWNKFGLYGSKFNAQSIWNKYGKYGGSFNDYSPFNKFARNPPVLVDANGKFYGYFTADRFFTKRTSDRLALSIIENWEVIADDVWEGYEQFYRRN